MPCLPLHGPRSTGRISGAELISPDYVTLIHFFAQAVWDVRRCIDWVRQRDAPAVGLQGISLGGYNVALVSSFEPNLDCVIAGHSRGGLPQRGARQRALDPARLRRPIVSSS